MPKYTLLKTKRNKTNKMMFIAITLLATLTINFWFLNNTAYAKPTSASNDIKIKQSAQKHKTLHHSRQKFIETILPHAIKTGKTLKVDPKVILAQAALESNWGRSIPLYANKSNTFNIFGIKYTPNANTKFTNVKTTEYVKGQKKSTTAKFRVYNNYAEAFADYTRLMQKPRYQKNIKNVSSANDYAKALQKSGYATNPKYATHIMAKYNDPILKKIKI